METVEPMSERYEMFFRFMYERQMVWHKRNTLGQPFPWTDDPIIRDNHFTNVYRDLDNGTVWFHQHRKTGLRNPTNIWESISYRLVNRISTFEAWLERSGMSFPEPTEAGVLDFCGWLRERKAAGEKVFTGRHLNIGLDKLETALLSVLQMPQEWRKDMMGAKTGQEVVDLLMQIKGIGKFFAFQIYEDLWECGMYPEHEDWCYLGPGAIEGMDIIFGSSPGKHHWGYGMVQGLKDASYEEFKKLGLAFPYPPMESLNGRWTNTLRMKDVEHSLCEFSKYYRMLHGGASSGKRTWTE